MYMCIFRTLDINQEFYLFPNPNGVKLSKISGGKAMMGDTPVKMKPTNIIYYK
jgi:hypothetical protein